MSYVPIVVPPTQHTQLSPRTRELADLLGRVIQEYETHHPSVTGQEIRTALTLAAQSSKSAKVPARRVVVLSLVLGLAMFAGIGVFIQTDRGDGATAFPVVAVAVAVVLVALLMAALGLSRKP